MDVPEGVRCRHAPDQIKTLFDRDTLVLLATLEKDDGVVDRDTVAAVRAQVEIRSDGNDVYMILFLFEEKKNQYS